MRWGWSACLLFGCVLTKHLEQEPLLWGLHVTWETCTADFQESPTTAGLLWGSFHFHIHVEWEIKEQKWHLAGWDFSLDSEKITSFSSWSQDLVLGLFQYHTLCIPHLCKVQKYKTSKSHTVTILAYQSPTHFERNALKRGLRPLNPDWRKLPAQSIL